MQSASGRKWDYQGEEMTGGGEGYVQFECDRGFTDVFICDSLADCALCVVYACEFYLRAIKNIYICLLLLSNIKVVFYIFFSTPPLKKAFRKSYSSSI